MAGKFHPTTTAEEARALAVGCLQAIASGWSLLYMQPAKIQGLAGNQAMEPDIDRMIADAADIAARITRACADRIDSSPCNVSPNGNHVPGELGDGESYCTHCGKGLPQ
jgi:hypothetical protein